MLCQDSSTCCGRTASFVHSGRRVRAQALAVSSPQRSRSTPSKRRALNIATRYSQAGRESTPFLLACRAASGASNASTSAEPQSGDELCFFVLIRHKHVIATTSLFTLQGNHNLMVLQDQAYA
ncbi:hypothetical protein WJX74_002073 [Apatococcus lobatus]|uniref:Uncharacterized protein n=1 Tax=Apatococcus lobatus TaxID=904363 RepID=A0AAW1RCR4_9CHLO